MLLENCVLFLVLVRDTTWRRQQDFKKQTENFFTGTMAEKNTVPNLEAKASDGN